LAYSFAVPHAEVLLCAFVSAGTGVMLVRPGEFGGRYVCELLVSLPDPSAR
jgi:hypothetical protein